MSDIEVAKVENPVAMQLDSVRELMKRAFGDGRFGTTPEGALEGLRRAIGSPGVHVWMALDERGDAIGFGVIVYAPWEFAPNAFIAHFHVDRPAAREPLLARMYGWGRSKGIRYVNTVNATQRSDRAHMRLFRGFGRGKVVGSYLVYDLEEEPA